MKRLLVAVVIPALLLVGLASVARAGDNHVVKTVASFGDVGRHSSLVLTAAGHPVISTYRSDNTSLAVATCFDPACVGGTVVTPTFDAGGFTSIALNSLGHPVVSYLDALDPADPLGRTLRVLSCGDAFCLAGNTITSLGTANADATSLYLDATGNPVIAFSRTSGALMTRQVRILDCGNVTCSSGNTTNSMPTPGRDSSMVLDASGIPAVAYFQGVDQLHVVRCNDTACTSTTDSTPGVAATDFASIVIDSSDRPVVSFYDETSGDLGVLRCGNATCSSGNTVTSPDTGGDVGAETSLALDSTGKPVIAYRDVTNDTLKILRCGNDTCTAGNTFMTPDPATGLGTFGISLALDAADNVVVSYYDASNGDLRLLRCDEATCTPPMCDGQAVTVNMNTNGGNGTGTAGADVILGTPGDDTIDGNEGNDFICGRGGSDTIRGNQGDDAIFGEGGGDTIRGGGGADTIDGGTGADELFGQGGTDTIDGGSGDDTINGLGAADELFGGTGADTINGQNGGDTIEGGPGTDNLAGQTGPDTMRGDGDDDELFGGNGADTLYGGPGFDKCSGNLGPDQAQAATCERTPGVETLF